MSGIQELLERFHVSRATGFLLKEPLRELPPYFEPWNFAAREMPNLVVGKRMRDTVGEMELLDHTRLSSYKEYRLAHLQLSLIASGYIWQDGDRGVANVLPECIAVPWCGVANYLGIKPILSHCSFALANWRWSEEEGCIKNLYAVPGGTEANWFEAVTSRVEMDFAPALECLLMAIDNADQRNVNWLIENLKSLTTTLHRMKESLSTMHDHLTARTFYNVIRPYLSGWGGEGSPLPDGLIYQGVSDVPMKMIGASAAQSSTLQCMDALLGVTHEPDTDRFLKEMRYYMVPAHRDFITWIENKSTVKELVNKMKQSNEGLSTAYNACLKSVVDFRSYHIQIVTKYIVLMANETSRSTDFDSLATKGTGGSDLLPFLKTLRGSTSECLNNQTKGNKES